MIRPTQGAKYRSQGPRLQLGLFRPEYGSLHRCVPSSTSTPAVKSDLTFPPPFPGVYLCDILKHAGLAVSPSGKRPRHVIFEGADDLPQGRYGTSQVCAPRRLVTFPQITALTSTHWPDHRTLDGPLQGHDDLLAHERTPSRAGPWYTFAFASQTLCLPTD